MPYTEEALNKGLSGEEWMKIDCINTIMNELLIINKWLSINE